MDVAGPDEADDGAGVSGGGSGVGLGRPPHGWLDPERVRWTVARTETRDLLDAWALLDEEFESDALAIFARELAARGVSTTERARRAYRKRRLSEVLTTRHGAPARCQICGRLAVRGLVVRFYLLLVIPLGSATVPYCEAHEEDVAVPAGRLLRWLSNLVWGARWKIVDAGVPS